MRKRSKNFQLEIRLGLSIIILVLIILNFASHYTLYRIKSAVQNEIVENLHEAAIVLAGSAIANRTVNMPDSVIDNTRYQYELANLTIESLNFDRVLDIQTGRPSDFKFMQFHSKTSASDLKRLLYHESVYIHNNGSKHNLVLYPFDLLGSKYIIALENESPLLSSIEQAGTILFFAGILGIAVIIYSSFKFIRFVIKPYKQLKDKAIKSGRYLISDENEIDDLLTSYESIIADLKKNETELLGQVSTMMEMSGGLAHQLRNSIGGIIGFARLIQKKAVDKTVGGNVENLITETKEAESLVSRFLDFAKPLTVYSDSFNLNILCKSIAENAERKYSNIDISLEDTDIVIDADRLLLKQALANIVYNACAAMKNKGGSIIISAKTQNEITQISVKDYGPGISAEIADNIFTPFVSGSPSGTGLGLPLAMKIIKGHNGVLECRSDSASGAEFIIKLPSKAKSKAVTESIETGSIS